MTNSTLPSNLTKIFTNFVNDTTIASPFDIQYRNWYETRFTDADNEEQKAVSGFKPLTSMLLDNKYTFVEGLIVDNVNGSIGFRNHTLPTEQARGAQWTEDLLWITPVTHCTNTNISLHFTLQNASINLHGQAYLQDDGGFASLAATEPTPKWSENEFRNVGPEPDLQSLSYHAAWWDAQLASLILNVTTDSDPRVGDKYPGSADFVADLTSMEAILVDRNNGFFLDAIAKNQTAHVQDFLNYSKSVQL